MSEARVADCLFCRIVAGEIPATKVHEDDDVLAIRDIAPRAPTHILILPKAHIASAADLTPADRELLGRIFGAAAEPARAEGISQIVAPWKRSTAANRFQSGENRSSS